MEGGLGDALAGAGSTTEMSGKDLIPRSICRQDRAGLGGEPPETLTYELFLDEQGQKFPNRRAMGFRSMNGWPMGRGKSVALHVPEPRAAKRLYFDAIPGPVDEYSRLSRNIQSETAGGGGSRNPVCFVMPASRQ